MESLKNNAKLGLLANFGSGAWVKAKIMKIFLALVFGLPIFVFGQNSDSKLFIDVHNLEPGEVTFEDVKAVHEKDLEVEGKHKVHFIKFWVDEAQGKVYCLSKAETAHSIYATHKEAHGLVPNRILEVTAGSEVELNGGQLFLDIHRLQPGSVTAEAVAEAHKKDLAIQENYGVNFINYWLDEKEGVILCLSEAPNSEAVIQTHKHAHGLVPAEIGKVEQGQ